jgi:hypothetical protein
MNGKARRWIESRVIVLNAGKKAGPVTAAESTTVTRDPRDEGIRDPQRGGSVGVGADNLAAGSGTEREPGGRVDRVLDETY